MAKLLYRYCPVTEKILIVFQKKASASMVLHILMLRASTISGVEMPRGIEVIAKQISQIHKVPTLSALFKLNKVQIKIKTTRRQK